LIGSGSYNGFFRWPEQEIGPKSGAVDCEAYADQLVSRVDRFLCNICCKCHSVGTIGANLVVCLIVEADISIRSIFSVCHNLINKDMLDLSSQVDIPLIMFLAAKQNNLAVFEVELDTKGLARLALSDLEDNFDGLSVLAERSEQVEVFLGRGETVGHICGHAWWLESE